MERHSDFIDFVSELMPNSSASERETAMHYLDAYILIMMKLAEQAEVQSPSEIRVNRDRGV